MMEPSVVDNGLLQDARRKFQEDVLRRIPEHDSHGIGDGFYAPDAYLCPWSGGAFFGLDHVQAFWRAMLEAGLAALCFEQQWIEQSGNLAYEIGQYTMHCRPTVAHRATEDEVTVVGSYLAVLRRGEDRAWRIAAEMYTCPGNELAVAHLRMPARASEIRSKGFDR